MDQRQKQRTQLLMKTADKYKISVKVVKKNHSRT